MRRGTLTRARAYCLEDASPTTWRGARGAAVGRGPKSGSPRLNSHRRIRSDPKRKRGGHHPPRNVKSYRMNLCRVLLDPLELV